MRVDINTIELVYAIRRESYAELAVLIQDEDLRYKTEPGSERNEELKKYIKESFSELMSALTRFIQVIPSMQDEDGGVHLDDLSDHLPDVMGIDFKHSERRLTGKIDLVARLCNEYLIHSVLFKHYRTVGQLDLAKSRSEMAAACIERVSALLHLKGEPVKTPTNRRPLI